MSAGSCACSPTCRWTRSRGWRALQGAEINDAKKVLADEATRMIHGVDAAVAARGAAEKAFEQGALSDDLPTFEVPRADLDAGILLAALAVDAGLAGSRGEARRLAQGGGLRVNDKAEPDANRVLTAAATSSTARSSSRRGRRRSCWRNPSRPSGPAAPRRRARGRRRAPWASSPRLTLSASSPKASRRQPCRAGTSASSSAAIFSRSETVAISLDATSASSARAFSSTLSSSTTARGRLLRGVGLGPLHARALGVRAGDGLADGGQQVRPEAGAGEALGHRAQAVQPVRVGGRLGGQLVDRLVLQDAAARLVAGSGRSARARRPRP